jgi:hypothetical protein
MRDDDVRFPVLRLMRRYGIPVTRERYVFLNFMGSPPAPEEWMLEHELELPEELQDLSRFERPQRKGRRR